MKERDNIHKKRDLLSLEQLNSLRQRLKPGTRETFKTVDVFEGMNAPLPEIVADPDQRYQPFPLTDLQQAYWIGRNGSFQVSNVGSHIYYELEVSGFSCERFSKAWQRLI